VGLVAGIAGYDSEDDLKWVEGLTKINGLSCRKQHVNDAVIAHAGAFLTKPGIIVISGTGSIIFAIIEEGKKIRNFDLHHYAYSAARFLSYYSVFSIMAGETDSSDKRLIEKVLVYWGMSNISDLHQIAIKGF
jgi:glucosamine kinase